MSPAFARLVGRAALRDRIAEVTPDSTPALEAIAHVICAMGGHIPFRDTESTGSCAYHRKVAAVALEQAGGAVVPPGACFAALENGAPAVMNVRCELLAGHAGAHECDDSMYGSVRWAAEAEASR